MQIRRMVIKKNGMRSSFSKLVIIPRNDLKNEKWYEINANK